MSAAREEVLARIRAGLPDVPAGERPEDVVVPRTYRRTSQASDAELVEQFAAMVR